MMAIQADVDGATAVLEGIVEEMDRRTNRLETLGARNPAEARSNRQLSLPYHVVVVEELADLFSRSRAAEPSLVRLAQKGRAAGIHLILATQHPDAETLSGQLRSNIPSRIALTVQKSIESKIILDETGAERLTGRGDMQLRLVGEQTLRVHGVYALPDDIAAAVREAGRMP